jgi:hypothetical protein
MTLMREDALELEFYCVRRDAARRDQVNPLLED